MDEKQIKKILTALFKHLDIKPQEIDISKDETGAYHLQLNFSDQDTGVLIGYRGDTVAALQLILGLMLYKKSGAWTRLVVNIGDYRQKRQQSLEKMAQDTVQRVKFSGEPIALFNLNPFERRIIHTYLSDHPDVITQSEGEGKNRHLIISLKNPSIDQPPPPDDNQFPAENETTA